MTKARRQYVSTLARQLHLEEGSYFEDYESVILCNEWGEEIFGTRYGAASDVSSSTASLALWKWSFQSKRKDRAVKVWRWKAMAIGSPQRPRKVPRANDEKTEEWKEWDEGWKAKLISWPKIVAYFVMVFYWWPLITPVICSCTPSQPSLIAPSYAPSAIVKRTASTIRSLRSQRN